MGFGPLFVGTVLTLNIVAHEYTDFFAYLLMLLGLLHLKEYGTKFKSACISLFPLLAVGATSFVLSFLDFLEIYSSAWLSSKVSIANHALLCLVTLLILRAVSALAVETELPSLRVRAIRNGVFAGIYHGCMIFLNVATTSVTLTKIQLYMLLPVMLFGLVYLFLECKLIYSCYMWICPEEDVDMHATPSRFSFVNRFRAFDNKIDDKTASNFAERGRRRLIEEAKRKQEEAEKKASKKGKKK